LGMKLAVSLQGQFVVVRRMQCSNQAALRRC
jgi:hypothetical protein